MAEENEPSHTKTGFFVGWKAQVQGFLIGTILTGALNYFLVGMRMERNDTLDAGRDEKIGKGQLKDEDLMKIDREYENRITRLEGRVDNVEKEKK